MVEFEVESGKEGEIGRSKRWRRTSSLRDVNVFVWNPSDISRFDSKAKVNQK